MDSIVAWLEQLKLGQYAQAFEKNAIDIEVAAGLSESDLKELGIALLGHRKRLLEAIDLLRRRTSGDSAPERRHLTVMFCDIVASTQLTARLDPEHMSALIGEYRRCCSAAIERFGGFVAQYMGDGIMAYFGYPRAQEDSAERAVRSALSLVRDISKLEVGHGASLRVRVGIATGTVVVESVTGGGSRERNAIGETPNLAARLESAAAPDCVVIAASTYRLVSGLFECVELEDLALKGFSSPVKAWQVMRELPDASRFDARRTKGLTPHIGRHAELVILGTRWRSARAGSGRVVLITGEPGIGKSRLVHEIAKRTGGEEKLLISWAGSPYLQNSPLGPVIAQLERSSGFLDRDQPEAKREKLDALLAAAPQLSEPAAPLLASLLSLPPAPGDPPPDPDAGRQKRKTLNAIVDLIAKEAAARPVMLACEDMHWFDPTTLELVGILVEQLAPMPLLLIATYRPNFLPVWGERTFVSTLALDRLGRSLATEMVEQVAHGKGELSPSLLDRILDRADGIPLFIEELTKSVLESGSADAAAGEGREPSISIPDTLHDSLVARLERMAPAKEIAQIGAAIGREFSHALLVAVASVGESALGVTLTRLERSGLLQRRDLPSGTVYAFKHALVQDAAYATLLHSRRRAIHRRIAEALETLFAETIETQPERLAEHWELADAAVPAIRYWTLAGQRASARSAALEAETHFRRALRLIERLPSGDSRDRLELEISVQQGGVLRATRGPPAVDTGIAFARARALCRRTGDSTHLVPALAGRFGYHFVRAENSSASEVAHELLAYGELKKDRLYRMIGHRTVGMVLVHTGNPAQGGEQLERSMELYVPESDGALAFIYGTDHAQTTASFLAMAHWLLGSPDTAAAREDWGVAQGSKINHLYSIAQTAMFRIIVRALARDWVTVYALAQETLEQALRHSFRLPITLSRFYLAASESVRQPSMESVRQMQAAAEAWGPINYRPMYLGMIAQAQAAAGDSGAGLQTLTEARAIVAETGERWIEPELCRLAGELKAIADPSSPAAAEAAMREALALARKQSARSWELRAALSLGRALLRRGQRADARAILLRARSSFKEGLTTPDINDATDLLREI